MHRYLEDTMSRMMNMENAREMSIIINVNGVTLYIHCNTFNAVIRIWG